VSNQSFIDRTAADDTRELWVQRTVAEKLDIGVRTLERWRATGQFPEPDFKMGPRKLFWRPETVRNWILARGRAAS